MLRLSAFTMIVVCCLNEVALARPADNHDEKQFIMELPVQTQIITLKPGKEMPPTQEPKTDNTREIIEKIKQINENLKKPHRKHYYTYQKHLGPMDTRDVIMNSFEESQTTEPIKYSTAELLEKIRQINENLKKNTSFNSRPQIQFPNYINAGDEYTSDHGEDIDDQLAQLDDSDNFVYNTRTKRSSVEKLIPYLLTNPTASDEEPIGYTAPSADLLKENEPILNLPKYLVVPINTHQVKVHNRLLPSSTIKNPPLLKQLPGLPNLPWPLAQYFPILIKDPFLALLYGGGLNNIIEYGQNADVCNRGISKTKIINPNDEDINDNTIEKVTHSRRAGKAMKLRRRTSKNDESSTNAIPTHKKSKKSPIGYKKPSKTSYQTTETAEPTDEYDKENENEEDGNLRFSDFFGHKKPPIPSPGFFIGRLKVRKGGVAIAGPGGIATAGRGGTAIVGPGGLALTQPGGLAIAGPSARVVALSSDVDLNKLISLLRSKQEMKQADSDDEESTPRRLDVIPEGKEVATGPIVYYHKPEDT